MIGDKIGMLSGLGMKLFGSSIESAVIVLTCRLIFSYYISIMRLISMFTTALFVAEIISDLESKYVLVDLMEDEKGDYF